VQTDSQPAPLEGPNAHREIRGVKATTVSWVPHDQGAVALFTALGSAGLTTYWTRTTADVQTAKSRSSASRLADARRWKLRPRDYVHRRNATLIDYLIRPLQERRRDRQANLLRGLQVYN
jgi:hypothetical protein